MFIVLASPLRVAVRRYTFERHSTTIELSCDVRERVDSLERLF